MEETFIVTDEADPIQEIKALCFKQFIDTPEDKLVIKAQYLTQNDVNDDESNNETFMNLLQGHKSPGWFKKCMNI